MSILNQDLLTLDFWQDKVTHGKHTVPIGTGRADTSRLPARSVLQNASHFFELPDINFRIFARKYGVRFSLY